MTNAVKTTHNGPNRKHLLSTQMIFLSLTVCFARVDFAHGRHFATNRPHRQRGRGLQQLFPSNECGLSRVLWFGRRRCLCFFFFGAIELHIHLHCFKHVCRHHFAVRVRLVLLVLFLVLFVLFLVLARQRWPLRTATNFHVVVGKQASFVRVAVGDIGRSMCIVCLALPLLPLPSLPMLPLQPLLPLLPFQHAPFPLHFHRRSFQRPPHQPRPRQRGRQPFPFSRFGRKTHRRGFLLRRLFLFLFRPQGIVGQFVDLLLKQFGRQMSVLAFSQHFVARRNGRRRPRKPLSSATVGAQWNIVPFSGKQQRFTFRVRVQFDFAVAQSTAYPRGCAAPTLKTIVVVRFSPYFRRGVWFEFFFGADRDPHAHFLPVVDQGIFPSN